MPAAKKSTTLALARSGGVAGIRPPPAILDLANLPAAAAARIEALIAAADFFALPDELPEARPHADAFQYTLTVKSAAGRMHTVTFSEQSASAPLRELRNLVREQAKR